MVKRLSPEEVRPEIVNSLTEGNVKIVRTAALLGISTRTLQRCLQENGTNYSNLVDDVRYELACQRLRDPNEKIANIASDLGFADPSSFSRAFARWSGTQPKTYRARMLRGVDAASPLRRKAERANLGTSGDRGT